MRSYFDHEKLKVYQSALGFITWSTDLLTHVQAKAAVKDQLDRASTSIPLNIAREMESSRLETLVDFSTLLAVQSKNESKIKSGN